MTGVTHVRRTIPLLLNRNGSGNDYSDQARRRLVTEGILTSQSHSTDGFVRFGDPPGAVVGNAYDACRDQCGWAIPYE
jgi:hypothetical protein